MRTEAGTVPVTNCWRFMLWPCRTSLGGAALISLISMNIRRLQVCAQGYKTVQPVELRIIHTCGT